MRWSNQKPVIANTASRAHNVVTLMSYTFYLLIYVVLIMCIQFALAGIVLSLKCNLFCYLNKNFPIEFLLNLKT